MKELIIRIKEDRYRLFLQFLQTLDYVAVDPAISEDIPPPKKYNFSDLVGKLEWKGDAMHQQRQLRDEW